MPRFITEEDLDIAAALTSSALETILISGRVDPELGEPIDEDEAKRIAFGFYETYRGALIGQSVSFVKSLSTGLLFPDRLEQFEQHIRGWTPVQLADLAESDADEAERVVRDARTAQSEMLKALKETASLLIRRAIALGLLIAVRETEGSLLRV